MTSIETGHRPRQVLSEVGVDRGRDVRRLVLVTTPSIALQVVSTVDDGPPSSQCIAQAARRNKCRIHVIRCLFSLKDRAAPSILLGTPMTSTILFAAIGAALILVALFAARRTMRQSGRADRDLGVVSTRWISELRRDEPWTRS